MEGFLLNRFLRLFPPYLLAVAVSIAVHYGLYLNGLMPAQINIVDRVETDSGTAALIPKSVPTTEMFSPRNVLANVFVMPVIYGVGVIGLFPSYPFVSQYWALNVEIQYYLIAAMLGYLLYSSIPSFGRSSAHGTSLKVSPGMTARNLFVAALLALCFVLFLATVEFRVVQLRYFRYAPYFLIGTCLYYVRQHPVPSLIGLCGGVAGVVYESLHPAQPLLYSTAPFVMAVVLGSACAAVLSWSRVSGIWKSIDKKMGDLSYPLYLNHGTAAILCAHLFSSRGILVWLFALSMSVALAWILDAGLESFLTPLRDKVRGASI